MSEDRVLKQKITELLVGSSLDQETWVYQVGYYYLYKAKDSEGDFNHILVSKFNDATFPVNAILVTIWVWCDSPITVTDLLQRIVSEFEGDLETIVGDVVSALFQLTELGIFAMTSERRISKHLCKPYQPIAGVRSDKAERLVAYCLGDYANGTVPACSQDIEYLQRKDILMLETEDQGLKLSAGLSNKSVNDQKKIARALIDQRADIPDGFTTWVVRGDYSGQRSDPKQGLHVSGMRHKSRSDLVLLPTACRERYVGMNLQRQMEELEQSWSPWEMKSDTAWWGGALTGDWWKTNEPISLTRREVLYHFRDNPDPRVCLRLTELPTNLAKPTGVPVQIRFTKREAYTHKCMLLLPGNDIASASSWYFCGNSVVLMPEPHLEHILYFEMEPWVHYVPLEPDPNDVLVKLQWVLDNQGEAQQIVANSHQRLKWLCGPEYLWACNEVLRRLQQS